MTKIALGLLLIYFTSTSPLFAWDVDLSIYHDKTLAECENNVPCTRLARWQCIAKACGEGGSQRPTDCYPSLTADKAVADVAICQADSLPSNANLLSVVNALPGARLEDVIQGMMMLRAVRGNGADCAAWIREYIGPYGPSWTVFWVSAVSGCRILSNERTWQEEEGDYAIWKAVGSGQKQCTDIRNEDMRQMCQAGVLTGESQY
ncbi:MAG: hypothetical protein KA403_03985 [Candidatus Omnitrophica bacterium]|nr:hypothetical protein [Candidatus Omnitrophota bacterium]